MIRQLHPRGHRPTGPGASEPGTDSDRPMDTSPRRHTRERGRRQSGQGGHQMEGTRSQKLTSRRTSQLIHYKVNSEKMVQNTSRAGMESKVAHRHEGLRNLQTHTNAYQKGTLALQGAHQIREHAAGAAANQEDWVQQLPLRLKSARCHQPLLQL
jgi:hypothetical protein